MKIAIGQTIPRLQDTATNVAEACRLATQAASQGARLLLLPEGCLTGNALSSSDKQATLPTDAKALADLHSVSRAGDIVICAGFVTPFGTGYNIVHAVITPAEIKFQHKAFRASTEPAFLIPWPDPTREGFTLDGVRIVITICSEFGTPDVMAAVERSAPQLILHPSAGRITHGGLQEHAGENCAQRERLADEHRRVVTAAADSVSKQGVARIAANPIGFDGEAWWPGNSYAIDATGRIVIEIPGENDPVRMHASLALGELLV